VELDHYADEKASSPAEKSCLQVGEFQFLAITELENPYDFWL
jgi:hypothetical protein